MSLTFLQTMSIESKSPRIARWALKLSKYDIILQYRKGSENVPADALSRSVASLSIDLPDPYIVDLKRQIEKSPERFKDFKIVDGKVFKYISYSAIPEDASFRWKMLVPKMERKKIIEDVHREAHIGYLKTLAKIRERWYWPRMSSEVKRYCSSCEVCKGSKTPKINTRPVCGKPKECARPWEMISIDFLGPYPRSKRGNVWLLVVSDFFSKFVLMQCMKNATAPAVCTFHLPCLHSFVLYLQ